MLEQLKDLIRTLNEEIKYHENILDHQKGLESTLWGLEEQAKFPENASPEDQQQISVEINNCRIKIFNLRNLLQAHENKLKEYINSYQLEDKVAGQTPSCSGCSPK